jgi:uncharacterized protein YbgA (DUF1722 family)
MCSSTWPATCASGSRDARTDLANAIGEYQNGLVPLVTPLRLIGHYTTVQQVRYLAEQVYLDPYPKELMLRNHV